jgi:hypothetical protein
VNRTPLERALSDAIEALTWHHERGYPEQMTDFPRQRDAKALRQLKAALAALDADEGSWTVFNGGGAVVVDEASLEVAAANMTDERMARGWTAVQFRVPPKEPK